MTDHRRVLEECSTLTDVPVPAVELVRVLATKVAYEADVLSAWKTKDRTVLARLARSDLPALIARMKRFMEDYRADWYATSQPFGFECIQKRNAAALARLEEAKLRLDEYLLGAVRTIEELDEVMKPFGAYSPSGVIVW